MSNADAGLFFVDLVPPGFGSPMPKEDPDAVPQLTADEIQAVIDKAYAEGLDAGFKEGYEKGKSLANIENADEKIALNALVQQFSTSIADKNIGICEDVLSLALTIAKSMTYAEIQINPSIINHIIAQATKKFIDSEELKMIVHPDDAVIIRKYLDDELTSKQWQIIENTAVERGGCVIETAVNTLDARNETRWKLISESLGANLDWRDDLS